MPRNHSRRWALVIAFFFGGFTASLVYDWADYIFYLASSSGGLNASQQAFFYTWVAAIFYLFLAVVAYFLSKTGWIKPIEMIYFYIALIVIALLLGLNLPQANDPFWLFTAFAGLAAGVGVSLGVVKSLNHRGISSATGSVLLIFALLLFVTLTVLPTSSQSTLGSSVTSTSSPLFWFGLIAFVLITAYVLLERKKR